MTKTDEETFVPAEDFLGFPPGHGRKGMNFVKGVETEPFSAKFVALMREKGLVAPRRAAVKPENAEGTGA